LMMRNARTSCKIIASLRSWRCGDATAEFLKDCGNGFIF